MALHSPVVVTHSEEHQPFEADSTVAVSSFAHHPHWPEQAAQVDEPLQGSE